MSEVSQGLAGGGPSVDHPAARVEDRAAGAGDHSDRLGDLARVAVHARGVGVGEFHLGFALIRGLGELHILGNVDQDRAGAAGGCDVEGFVHGSSQVVHVADQDVVFCG
jgi:hypothetical protein